MVAAANTLWQLSLPLVVWRGFAEAKPTLLWRNRGKANTGFAATTQARPTARRSRYLWRCLAKPTQGRRGGAWLREAKPPEPHLPCS